MPGVARGERLAATAGVAPRPTNPQILATVAAYLRMVEPGTGPVGRAQAYRFICVEGWPGDCHYEFQHRVTRRELSAELHFGRVVFRDDVDPEVVARAMVASRASRPLVNVT